MSANILSGLQLARSTRSLLLPTLSPTPSATLTAIMEPTDVVEMAVMAEMVVEMVRIHIRLHYFGCRSGLTATRPWSHARLQTDTSRISTSSVRTLSNSLEPMSFSADRYLALRSPFDKPPLAGGVSFKGGEEKKPKKTAAVLKGLAGFSTAMM